MGREPSYHLEEVICEAMLKLSENRPDQEIYSLANIQTFVGAILAEDPEGHGHLFDKGVNETKIKNGWDKAAGYAEVHYNFWLFKKRKVKGVSTGYEIEGYQIAFKDDKARIAQRLEGLMSRKEVERKWTNEGDLRLNQAKGRIESYNKTINALKENNMLPEGRKALELKEKGS